MALVDVGASPSCGAKATLDIGLSFKTVAGRRLARIDRRHRPLRSESRTAGRGLFTRALRSRLRTFGLTPIAEMHGSDQTLGLEEPINRATRSDPDGASTTADQHASGARSTTRSRSAALRTPATGTHAGQGSRSAIRRRARHPPRLAVFKRTRRRPSANARPEDARKHHRARHLTRPPARRAALLPHLLGDLCDRAEIDRWAADTAGNLLGSSSG